MPGKLLEASVAELLVVSFELHSVFVLWPFYGSILRPFFLALSLMVCLLRNENGK